MHFINSPGFEMKKAPGSEGPPFSSVNDAQITNGAISIIRVPPGSIGCATSSKQPVLLGAGLHYISDPSFEWMYASNVTDTPHIKNGVPIEEAQHSHGSALLQRATDRCLCTLQAP